MTTNESAKKCLKKKPGEGPFVTLLRKFMAGSMTSKAGNARILAREMMGLSQE